jgi:drug/metabolite transporter (DMT)-like permease
MGAVTFAIGNILYVKGLKKLKTPNSAFMLYLTPFIALAWNFILLGETIRIYYLLPLVFIFIGYSIIIFGKKKDNVPKS